LPDTRLRQDICAVIPTLGRPEALDACLQSLAAQTIVPGAVMVVHSGDDAATREVCESWRSRRLNVAYFHSAHRGAALQRDFAIRHSAQPLILMCEDDVEFDRGWLDALVDVIESDPRAGAAMGRIVNQPFTSPRGVWRLYRRLVASRARASQPGAVIGALVANGFPLDAAEPMPTEWLGGGITLLRREAYLSVGGFAPHFRGSSPGEDVDLGYRMSRTAAVFYVPAARCVHHQLASGRERIGQHQFLSMRSRFAFCRASAGMSVAVAFAQIALWAAFQTLSELGQLRRGRLRPDFVEACWGRVRGAWSCVGWDPASERFPEWHDTHASA
jgi:GT2 family glycosyltransferase